LVLETLGCSGFINVMNNKKKKYYVISWRVGKPTPGSIYPDSRRIYVTSVTLITSHGRHGRKAEREGE
jgi:hypothetical protein